MARDLDRLLRVFASLLTPMAAGCGPSLNGGEMTATDTTADDGGDSTGGGIDETMFEEDLCGDDGPRILAAIAPAQPVGYIERRQSGVFEGPEGPEFSEPYVVESSGLRCMGAVDTLACEEAFAALPLESTWVSFGFEGDFHQSLAYNRNDEVGAIANAADLLSFLGPLDTAGDAALVATMEGHQLVCAAGNDAARTDDGYILHTTTGGGCGEGDDIEQHVILVHPDGTIEVLETVLITPGDPGCAVGRLPAGLCRRPNVAPRRRDHPVGRFFAEVAHLEAAAVTAFGQLAGELALHRAPRHMVGGALQSRREEFRHARATAALARRFGGRPVAPRVATVAPRAFVEVAADNAAEGCIRETFGALVAHAQARRAADPVIRRVLAGIAKDETRHAALSWELARWGRAKMTAPERRHVDREARHAVQRLEVELTGDVDPLVQVTAGMPTQDEARKMFAGLRDALLTARPA